MDTLEEATVLSQTQIVDAINEDWLEKSARSSYAHSTELMHYQLELSQNSNRIQHSNYGATTGSNNTSIQNQTFHASSSRANESTWLMRNYRITRATGSISQNRYQSSDNCTYNQYAINGHLYDNISFADSPLLRSISRKEFCDERNNCNSIEYVTSTPIDELHSRYLLDNESIQSNSFNLSDIFCGKFRFLLAAYVLLGITLAIYSRNALSLAAVGMIANNAINKEFVDIISNDPILSVSGSFSNINLTSKISSTLDGSCPLVYHSSFSKTDVKAKQVSENITLLSNHLNEIRKTELEVGFKASIKKRIESGQLIDWTPSEQGLIFAAGSVGNLLIAIPLTRMGEIYGPKWIIFAALLGATLQAALMPIVAPRHIVLVILFQVIFNGLTYGADCVAYTLFAHWLTPVEMAFFVSCLLICYQLGTILSSFVTAKILSDGLEWSWCFYTPAIFCGIWTLVWCLIGASEPAKSLLISDHERMFLATRSKIAQTIEKQQQQQSFSQGNKSDSNKPQHSLSWLKLAKDPNVWAIIAVKFTLRWYFSVYLSLMPTYLSSVAHMSVKTIGRMSVIQSLIGLFSGILMGYLTRSLVTKRPFNLSLATTRKVFQSIVNFGLAATLVVFIIYDCDQWVTIISLTVGGICINFYVAAALQLPLDLSPHHCGLITSITNTLALGQAIGSPISGLILNDGPKERYRWRIVWLVAIVLNSLSGIIFILLVDSKPRDYDKKSEKEKCCKREVDGEDCLSYSLNE